LFFSLPLLPPPPIPTLFPYTTLFRSSACTTARLCPAAAEWRGMTLIGFFATASTWAPCSSSSRAASSFAKKQAKCSGVNPSEDRSEEHTSELQSRGHLVCRLLLEKKK